MNESYTNDEPKRLTEEVLQQGLEFEGNPEREAMAYVRDRESEIQGLQEDMEALLEEVENGNDTPENKERYKQLQSQLLTTQAELHDYRRNTGK